MTLGQGDDDGMHVRRRTMTNSRGRVPKPSVVATPVVSFLTAILTAKPRDGARLNETTTNNGLRNIGRTRRHETD